MTRLPTAILLGALLNGCGLSAQICSVNYDRVSQRALSCFRVTGPQHGIVLRGGDSGAISAPGGGSGSFTWVPSTSKLSLTVTHLPLFASCSRATGEFNDFVNACRGIDTVTHVSSSPAKDVWRIDSPNVLQRETIYPQIRFASGNKVETEAGGCAQAGGPGNTWRLYVNPGNDDPHHGVIKLPGFPALKRIKDAVGPANEFTIPTPVADPQLHLGYESSNYTAGGYWGRDPGPNSECVGQPNAYVVITIRH